MKELVCNFSLVRFLPYRETGEFVNVGILLYAPEIHHFAFRLAAKTNRRVWNFFPEMDRAIYRASVEALRREMERQAGLFGIIQNVGDGLTVFRNMLRRRETLLHFAEPGMRLGEPTAVLDDLYAEFVERRFAQVPEYHETVMRGRLAGWLRDWGLRKSYKTDRRVGDAMFHLTLPFVHIEDNGEVTRAFKPLDLDRDEPTKVYDHGGLWIQRFERLKERRQLPQQMIVPVRLPTDRQKIAADEVVAELTNAGVTVVPFEDMERIHGLAKV